LKDVHMELRLDGTAKLLPVPAPGLGKGWASAPWRRARTACERAERAVVVAAAGAVSG
jgi:hypothetical protein